jgi:putative ABC transport system ATP-binding protein
MICIEDLCFRYRDGGFTLAIERLEIDPGTKVAFVGPSGSGKTTLLHLVAGILAPQQGHIRVGESDLTTMGDAARRNFRISSIGFVFQDFELIDYLNVRDNILLPYLINGSLDLTNEVRQSAEQLAGSVGLGDKLARSISHLSQGERQRVAICRALLTNPQVLLADEPTGNLDPKNKRRILDLLLDRAEATGATLIVVTHDHGLLDNLDRVVDFQQFIHPTPNHED